MTVVDCIGKLCPVPVIETKKAIEKLPAEGGVVQTLVDNSIACENLSKMAQHKGYNCTVQKQADNRYAVTITVGGGRSAEKAEPAQPQVSYGEGVVFAIGQDKMGGGNEELGKILIKGFIYALANLDIPPKAVLFFNSGVNLSLQGANTLEDLKELEKRGTIVRVCGACVDFYNCKDKVAVGEITNMYNIVEIMRTAQSVINI